MLAELVFGCRGEMIRGDIYITGPASAGRHRQRLARNTSSGQGAWDEVFPGRYLGSNPSGLVVTAFPAAWTTDHNTQEGFGGRQ
jgi:hypothetical protein